MCSYLFKFKWIKKFFGRNERLGVGVADIRLCALNHRLQRRVLAEDFIFLAFTSILRAKKRRKQLPTIIMAFIGDQFVFQSVEKTKGEDVNGSHRVLC